MCLISTWRSWGSSTWATMSLRSSQALRSRPAYFFTHWFCEIITWVILTVSAPWCIRPAVDNLYIILVEPSGSGRALSSRLREPRLESCIAVLTPWASFVTLHCSRSLSCINEYLAIDSGGYVYEQPSRINCSIWLDASQRSRDGVWLNRSVREVKCKVLWTILRIGSRVI